MLDHRGDVPVGGEELLQQAHRPGAGLVGPAEEGPDRLDRGLAAGADEVEDVLLLVGVGGLRVDVDGEAGEERAGGLGELHLAELLDGLLPGLGAAVLLDHLGLQLGGALGALAAEDVEDAHGSCRLLPALLATDVDRAPPRGGARGCGARRDRWPARCRASRPRPPPGWRPGSG